MNTRALTPTRRYADTPIHRCSHAFSALFAISLALVPFNAHAQWQPPPTLRQVPIKYDCRKTQHRIGAALQPNPFYWHGAIFLCPERIRSIDAKHPGASRFFLVHEYGHLALHTENEAEADEWAAKQLAAIPKERETLRAVLQHFVDNAGIDDPLYGTGIDRAFRIANAARLPAADWPSRLRDAFGLDGK